MFGNKKKTTTSHATEDKARTAIQAFKNIPGFDVKWYYSLGEVENITENQINRLEKLYSRLEPIADELKNSNHRPRIIHPHPAIEHRDVLHIPKSWSKDKLDKELNTFINGYVESDCLKNIKERGLQCRDIVEVPHEFTPFESKDKDKIHRIPKRIVSNINIRGEVKNSPHIRNVSITNKEYLDTYDIYSITNVEEVELIKDMEMEGLLFLDNKIPSFKNADIDIYKSQIYMDIIKIVTINAQEFTVKCVPEVTTMVIDRLNEAFGFYE